VIGGYLGAGKTTLLNHLLRHAAGRRIAVLVNDFGDIGIDADLIETRGEDVLELAGGCVCCSFGSDLVGALQTLSRRRPPPDHVVLEASGVALPAPVAQAVGLVPGIEQDAIVVMVDAETVRKLAVDRYVGETVTAQLRQAHLIVVNKPDLVDDAERRLVAAWLAEQAPDTRIIEALRGRAPVECLLGWPGPHAPAAPGVEAVPANLFTTRHGGRWRQPALSAPNVFASASFHVEHPVDARRLADGLTDPALGIIRAKALVDDHGGVRTVLQLVGARIELRRLGDGSSSPREMGRLVCIGLRDRLDVEAIAARMNGAMQRS
jgi:G3E family GTPase